jgi:hypothetical protein
MNVHFPDIKDIEYNFHTFKFTGIFKDEYQVEKMSIHLINFTGLITDFRFKDQSNHKIYIKFYNSFTKLDLTCWLNACESCGPLGIIDKDDVACLNIKESTTYKRICFINRRVKPAIDIYIRIGIPIDNRDINIGNIELEF